MILLETMCLPPISVISAIVKHSRLLVEANEHYQKRSYRNRIYLNGPQGKMLTTIPLQKGKNAQLPITQVRISNEDPWAAILLKQIKSNYGSAPFFDFLFDDLSIILNQKWESLWELNNALRSFTFQHLGINIETSFTSSYRSSYSSTNQSTSNPTPNPTPNPTSKPPNESPITDLRNSFRPGKSETVPDEIMITLPQYEQVFSDTHPFIPDLSILDLLMCCGPESILMLR